MDTATDTATTTATEHVVLETRTPSKGSGAPYQITLECDGAHVWLQCTCPSFMLSAKNEDLAMAWRECKHIAPWQHRTIPIPGNWGAVTQARNALSISPAYAVDAPAAPTVKAPSPSNRAVARLVSAATLYASPLPNAAGQMETRQRFNAGTDLMIIGREVTGEWLAVADGNGATRRVLGWVRRLTVELSAVQESKLPLIAPTATTTAPRTTSGQEPVRKLELDFDGDDW